MVVNHRNLARATAPAPPPNPNRKGKGKKKKKNGLSFGELMASGDGDESEDFESETLPGPRSPTLSTGGGPYMFSSTHHSAGQRLYYLLATRPPPTESTGAQQQSGGVRSAAGGGDAAAVEGGCHALVFVETTAVAQELAGELKALGLVAFALHDRTPKAQVSMRWTFQTSNIGAELLYQHLVKGRTHRCKS